MNDDSELDGILHELKSPTTDNYRLISEAKAALELWKQRAVAEARIDEQRHTTIEGNEIAFVVADHIVMETISQQQRIKQLTAQPNKEESV